MNNPASKVRPSRLASANLLWALAFLVSITIIVGVAWPRTLGAQNELRLDRSSLAVTSQTSTTVGFGAIDTASISYSGSVDRTNAGAPASSAQGSAPDTPDQPTGTAVFIGGVDLEWNDVPEADSYDVQLYRNGQWNDLPGDGVEIAFYGAGAIISGLDPGSSLWFQVRARNARGSSDWSNFISLPSTNQFEAGRRARPDNVTASGAPSVNGTPQVGETLTADTTGISDGNGLDRVQFRFQWVSNDGSQDTDIASATGSSYTLSANDEGRTIKVRVSFTDRGGYAELLTSSATAVVGPFSNRVATGAPVITGTAQVGNSLTADTSNIADVDGLANVSYSYQWISNDGSSDTEIEDATGSSYTLVAADEGNTIKVRVSFTDDAGNGETLTSSATAAVAAQAEPVSFITVEVTADRYHREAQLIAVTWTDVDDCSTNYNAYLHYIGEVDEVVHLGSATSSGTEITKLFDVLQDHIDEDDIDGFRVELYCGTDDAGRLVSEVDITYAAHHLTRGTYSSEPPLSGLSVGHGTLSPSFGRYEFSYNVLDVANDVTRTTITATPKTGYFVKFYESSGGWTSSSSSRGVPDLPTPNAGCHRQTTDGLGPMPELTDADPNTPGFQVDLYDGVNYITIYVYPIRYCDPGSGYDLGITRAEGSVSLVRPNRPPTGSIAIRPNYTGYTYGPCIGCILSAVDYSINDRDGLTDATYSYQWLADDAEIAGATSSSYTVASAVEGKAIKVRVSFTDDAGNDETLTSSATAAVTSNSAATGAPVITGTAHVGETLTATTAGIVDADGLVNVSYSYQWISNDGSSDTDIQNATGSSYTLVAGDEGNTIKVRVSFTDDAGNDETLTSSATAAVTSNSAATGAPRVVGVGRVGNTLTVDTFRIADANGLVNVFYSYQWISNDGSSDTDIQNATGSSYTVSIADRGKAIKVRVSFTDDRGTDETLTSSATAAVAAQAEPVSFITVEVTADRYHREAQFIAATWTDVDDCSTDYNAYLHIMGEVDELVHLGSATSNGTEIAKWVPALRDDIDGYPVELYCGTDAAGRLVSGVSIPSPANGTFSSEPPLRGLSVGHGTLSPIFIFDKNRISYNVLDVANDVTRTTITATPKTGYFVKYYESSEGGWTSSSSFLSVPRPPRTRRRL